MKNILETEHDFLAKLKKIGAVMKLEMGMRFRRITDQSIHANSPKNLILRQQFAMEFLKQWKKDKLIINVDETWLGMTDFRR